MIAKNKSKILIFAFFITFASTLVRAATPLTVVTTIYPVSSIVKAIGQSHINVINILPPGANPHTFELSPKLMRQVDKGKIVFAIGAGLDEWVLYPAEMERVSFINLSGSVNKIGNDPHYWLSMENAKRIARQVSQTLKQHDPDRKADYEKNLESYLKKIDEADSEIRKIISDVKQKKIITFHDGWRYFAKEYGFDVVGFVESGEGRELTPAGLTELKNVVRNNQIKVLFSEPGENPAVVKTIAKELDLKIHELDPFGKEGQNFEDLMLSNAKALRDALGE